MPPRRGRGRARRVPVDNEVAFASHAPPPQGEPHFPSGFQVPHMPQLDFFPPMTPEAFQGYTKFWYAQAQAGQGQYPVPPMAT